MVFTLLKKKEQDITGFKVSGRIGFIMDGRGSWSRKRGPPSLAGHVVDGAPIPSYILPILFEWISVK